MPISKNKRVQTPFRLNESDLFKVKELIAQDHITFQKLVEVLLLAYIKGNKEIKSIVTKYADEKSSKKRRYSLTDMEANDLLKFIEEEESPLRHLDLHRIAKESNNG